MMKNLLFLAWIFVSLLLVLYSYTQISLSLAINKIPFLFGVQQAFQYVGYFNRPLSSLLYVLLIGSLASLYVVTLTLIQKNVLSTRKTLMIIISMMSIILFSYNAFSHDIFNYIFDAKIFTVYNLNPYLYKALDFPNDPMLSFMHWTHRTYPYGPFWLALTIPLSYIGMNIFLLTFFLFKLLSVVSYGITAWFIYKIVQNKNKKYALFSAAFFALNPLMIIEFLVSGHNDIVMLMFALVAVYVMTQNRKLLSGFLLFLSVGIKYATGFLLPAFLVLFINPKFYERALYVGIILMIGAIIAASLKSGNFQPWYFSYAFVIASLLSYRKYITFPVIMFSFFACFHYLPYLYTGTWDAPVPQILSIGLIVAIVCSFALFLYTIFISLVKRSRV